MRDVFKVLLFFGVFLALCVIGDLIAEYAPCLNYILIPVAIWITLIAIFGNHFNNGKEENK